MPPRSAHRRRSPRHVAAPATLPSPITLLATAVVLVVLAAGPAACGGPSGGSSGGTSPSPPSPAVAAPLPVPSPQITSGPPPAGAVEVARRFWDLLGDGRTAEALRLTTSDSGLRQVEQWGVAEAHFVSLEPHSVAHGVLPAATVEFAVKVFIRPEQSQAGSQWGAAREYELFENVVRMSDGTWRLVASGTGP